MADDNTQETTALEGAGVEALTAIENPHESVVHPISSGTVEVSQPIETTAPENSEASSSPIPVAPKESVSGAELHTTETIESNLVESSAKEADPVASDALPIEQESAPSPVVEKHEDVPVQPAAPLEEAKHEEQPVAEIAAPVSVEKPVEEAQPVVEPKPEPVKAVEVIKPHPPTTPKPESKPHVAPFSPSRPVEKKELPVASAPSESEPVAAVKAAPTTSSGVSQKSVYVYRCMDFGVRPNSALIKLFEDGAHHDGYDFHKNYLGDRGLLPVIEALKLDSGIVSLNLAAVGMHNKSALILIEALKSQTKLTHLDLSENQISDSAAKQIISLIRALPILKKVLLAGNPISGTVFGLIAMELERSTN